MTTKGVNTRTYILMSIVMLFSATIIAYISFKSGESYAKEDARRDLHEYQMEVDEKEAAIYDNGRYVGTVKFEDNPTLDELILRDNL